ncbi:hypothetical protein V8C26DRAFT_399345 [Trichoderma gracile]
MYRIAFGGRANSVYTYHSTCRCPMLGLMIATMQGPWGVLKEPEPKWWIELYPFPCHEKQLGERDSGCSTPYFVQSALYEEHNYY